MNLQTKIRISILLCFILLFYSFQPVRSVGAASIGEPVPTDVSYWGFDENTTSSILNQGYNNILCLWDFENHEYLLVKCPDHMYYVPGGIICIDGDYTGLFDKLDYQNYIRDQIVYSWGREKGYFNLTASQYFTVYRVSSDGSISSSEVSQFNGVVNGTAWNSSKTKYNALRWLYENESTIYNSCNYALCWATDSIDYAYSGSGNPSIDLVNWASGVLLPGSNHTEISFTGGSTLNASASDIPVYTFYPGGFNFTSPVAVTPTPTPEATPSPPVYGIPFDCPYTITWNNPVLSKYTINNGAIIRVRDEANDNYEYYYILSGYNNSWTYQDWKFNFDFNLTSDNVRDTLSLGTTVFNNSTSHRGWVGRLSSDINISSDANFTGTNTNNFIFTSNPNFLVNFVILNSSGSYYIDGLNFIDNSIPSVSPTPSPTSSPTPTPYAPIYASPTPSPAPSPGVTITPTQGPTETSVKELHGWKKALKDILQSVFVGNTDAIQGYFKDAVGGYQIVQNPFKKIVDSIYVDGSDQENFNPFENQQVDFVFDVHDQNGDVLGGEHTANWRLTILPKTFWEWLKSYSNYFEVVFYLVDASFLGATMKRWLTKQNNEGSETKEGDGS